MTLQATLNQAVQLLKSGRAAEAEATLQPALKAAPGHPDILHLLGLAAKARNDPGQAEDCLRRSLQQAPRQPAVWNNLGNVLVQADRPEEAIAAYERAVALTPQYFDAWKNLGLARAAAGRHAEALTAFDRALALAPGDANVLVAKGLSLSALERLDEAELAHSQAVAAAPNAVMALNNLGNVLRDRGKDQDAALVFERAARTAPRSGHLRVALSGTYFNLGRFDEAERLLLGVIEAEPNNIEAHRTLTTLYFTTGRQADIAQAFDKTLSRHPRLPEVWQVYAETMWHLDEHEAGLSVIDRAEAACGQQPQLSLIRGRLMSSNGAPEEALEHLSAPPETPVELVALFAVERARAHLRLGAFATGAADLYESAKACPEDYSILAHLESLWRLVGDERSEWLLDYNRFVRAMEVPVPDGYRDHAQFNADLAEALTALHVSDQHPIDQTVRGGTQTFGNLFRRTEPVITALKGALEEAIRAYTSGLEHQPDHPFLRHLGGPIAFKGSWSVRLRGEGFHVHHYHPQGWISSAYYVALPRDVADPSIPDGRLEFGMPPVEVPVPVEPVTSIQPRIGTLALFPSYCLHGTVPFHADDPRLTVAFDVARDAQ